MDHETMIFAQFMNPVKYDPVIAVEMIRFIGNLHQFFEYALFYAFQLKGVLNEFTKKPLA